MGCRWRSFFGSRWGTGCRSELRGWRSRFDADGAAHERVVSRLENAGQLYGAANHWTRAWYRRSLKNPDVQATLDGVRGSDRAVPVTSEEHDRVEGANRHGLGFRILTGFPPRYFVRLDPH